MNKKIKTDAVDHLFDAILSLQNKEECYAFFEDLCTVNELLSLSQRFEVAAMLKEGKTYLDIAEKTGASTATISRSQPFLKLRQRRLRAGFIQEAEASEPDSEPVSPAGPRGGTLQQDLESDPVNTVMHTFCLHYMSKKERRLRKTFPAVPALFCCFFQNDQRSSAFFANSVLTRSSYATRFVSSPPSSRISCSRINASSEKIRSVFHVSCST